MRSFVKYLLILFLLALAANSYCASTELKANNEVKKVVDDFCLMEFQGKLMDEERGTLVKYTPASEDYKKFKKLVKNASEGEHLYPYEWDMSKAPFFIVDKYDVIRVVQTNETHAYAIVNYHQLAKVEKNSNYGNYLHSVNFIKDVHDITVQLNIVSNPNKIMKRMVPWLIENPPYPKVSYDAVLKYYGDKESTTKLRLTKAKELSLCAATSQKIKKLTAAYNNEKLILDFLIDLKK